MDSDDSEFSDQLSEESGEFSDELSEDSGEDESSGVYVLRYVDRTYYVGKTTNMPARLAEHRTKGDFEVLKPETPGSAMDLESWERNETLHRMLKHGVDKVRGWMFTSRRLSESNLQDIFAQICEKYDLCRRCGRATHFASGCYARTRAPWCGLTAL